MSSPTDEEVNQYIEEIVGGVEGIEKRLGKDVRAMCEILSLLVEECKKRVANEGDIPQRMKRSFKDIYGSLKLHLKFHLGDATEIIELETLGQEIGLTAEERDAPPGKECAIDPGSKLLEIVSIILQSLSLCFSTKLGKYRRSGNFFALPWFCRLSYVVIINKNGNNRMPLGQTRVTMAPIYMLKLGACTRIWDHLLHGCKDQNWKSKSKSRPLTQT